MNVDAVLAVYRRILDTPHVHEDSDFFAVGGDSLLATRVLSAVARESGVELTFDDMVGAATPASLAAVIAGAATTGDVATAGDRR